MESQEHFEQATRIVDSCCEELLRLIHSNEGWRDLGENEGVHGSMKSSDDSKQIIRARGVIQFPCDQICAFVWDNSKKKSWDGMLNESLVLTTFNDRFKIIYEQFNAIWPVSNRDFVFAAKQYDREDGILIVAKSIDIGYPARSGVVRGDLIVSGFYLKRLDERSTEVIYLVSMDPKGSIPGFIVNKLGPRQVLNVNKIRHVMGKNNG